VKISNNLYGYNKYTIHQYIIVSYIFNIISCIYNYILYYIYYILNIFRSKSDIYVKMNVILCVIIHFSVTPHDLDQFQNVYYDWLAIILFNNY